MRLIQKSLIASIAVSLYGAGYKLPEQSLNSVALSAAYVANTSEADTSYYNPARMSFLDDSNYIDTSIMLVHLPSITFKGTQLFSNLPTAISVDSKSEVENIPVGSFHYVSKPFGKWRFGASLVAPGGLSKRWDSGVTKLFAQEFTLKIIEFNPTFSYQVSDTFSIGGGVRVVYTDGKVKSSGDEVGVPLARDMEGDDISYGYNLALAWVPNSLMSFALTYRSNVDLKVDGSAKIYAGSLTTPIYNGNASVTVPLPATISAAVATNITKDLTLEFVFERTLWSKYKELDFNYNVKLPVMDTPIPKYWQDSNAYRVGITYKYSPNLTLMGGYSYDETPIPTTIGYELPDSDAHIFSAGFRYNQSENLSWGMALLYDYKKSRTVPSGKNLNGISGTFDEGGAVLATVGLSYKF